MNIVKDPQIMARILDIQNETNESKLFKEFVKQYEYLFEFISEGEEDKLHTAICKKVDEIFD